VFILKVVEANLFAMYYEKQQCFEAFASFLIKLEKYFLA
jgi:hypothetical protein